MANLITFPSSYVFVAGYNVYNSFMAKHISSLPVNSNNIAYLSTEKNLPNDVDVRTVVNYYKQNSIIYTKESAKITVLDSPLLNALVRFVYRYRTKKHISEKDFNYLYKKHIGYIRDNIDLSSIYYIYLRYYPTNSLDSSRYIDSLINQVLSSSHIFKYNSIYSKEEDRRIARFDNLLTARLKQVAKTKQFNEIIGKEA